MLEYLEKYPGDKIRVFGGGHSWSNLVVTDDITLDLRRINKMRSDVTKNGEPYVDLEAGCKMKDVLRYLRHQGYALPTYGVSGSATIAGAVSTATHGAGRPSLSNYVSQVTVATYDPCKKIAERKTFSEKEDLKAARCSLGFMGVILSMRIRCEPAGLVKEVSSRFNSLDEILEQEKNYSLLQFYLFPFLWQWRAHLRRPVDAKMSRSWNAVLCRMYRFVVVDLFFNLCVRILAVVPGLSYLFPAFFRIMLAPTFRGKSVIDDADRLLTMRHDLFRHVEMELFVVRDQLEMAATFVEAVLRYSAGEPPVQLGSVSQIISDYGDIKELKSLGGTYVHHYPITFRRVLKDNATISMTADEERYAISLISYGCGRQLRSFMRVCSFLAKYMAKAFGARPHWGKYFPLSAADVEALYPEKRLKEFRSRCKTMDPQGVFRNEFAYDQFGFDRDSGV